MILIFFAQVLHEITLANGTERRLSFTDASVSSTTFGTCLLNCIMVYVIFSLISQTIYSALQEDVDPEDATLMLA